KTEAGPLEVLRHAPDGDVPIAPHVSLTFSQPMVAVTSLAELEKLPSPAQLAPQPPGRWRWIGTKTLLFEPQGDVDRLPMATAYTVTVPAGTRSATGGSLAKEVSWKLATPPPTLQGFFPQDGPVTREPLLFASFAKRSDPQAGLSTVKVSSPGKEFGVRLATADEIKADTTVSRLAADAARDRQLVFRAAEPLPVDAYVTVAIGPGTPSAD